MKAQAAILVEPGRDLEMVELTLPALQPGQVLVEIAFSGVCRTQLLEVRGHRGPDRFLPHCLGHEGSGRVLETGAGVTRVRAGDPVIMSWLKGSGANAMGCVYDWQGRSVNAGAITTFQTHAVISENRLTRKPDDLPFDAAALVGCALATGAGAVINSAAAGIGESLVLFGAGGVGACALIAAAAAGCYPIVAVDIVAEKRDAARQFGATHALDPGEGDLLARLMRICPGGFDRAIEATGRPEVMETALAAVRPQGGTAVVLGNAHFGQRLTIDPQQLNQGKRLLGSWGGDSDPDRDFPRYARLIAAGRLALAPLLSHRFPLARVNDALAALETGRVTRPLLDLSMRG